MAALPLLVYALSAVYLYFVWFPEQTTRIAHVVGVGRGADLLFRCWLLASLIVMFNLHIKANEQLQMLTDLAWALALANRTARDQACGRRTGLKKDPECDDTSNWRGGGWRTAGSGRSG